MTIIRGSRTLAAPCCGAQYAFPRFVTMNFSAFEYWTDGWDDGVLMPKDYGIRLCSCGRFVLRREMHDVSVSDELEAPHMRFVPPNRIDECIASADSVEMERAARRFLWHELNHAYREQYRTHREHEETALRTGWESANPDRRTFWGRLVGRKAPIYVRPDVPMTFPTFTTTLEQIQNMTRLCELISEENKPVGERDMLELAELYRELGRLADAQHAIAHVPHDTKPVARRVIAKLIEDGLSSPIRFRY